MKRVLILVLSTERDFYGRLAETSRATWDAEEVEGVETIFYFGSSSKPSTDKFFYTDSDDEFHSMGKKTLCAFGHALANREWDYVFRANASLYVHKPGLLRYAQNWREHGLALGVLAPGSRNGEQFDYMWGPGYMLSRDIVQLVCDNRELWDHTMMDDNAISYLLHGLDIPLDNRGSLASLAIQEGGRQCTFYENGSGGAVFAATMKEVVALIPNQFAFRCKTDSDRTIDIQLMRELQEGLTA